MQFEKSNRKGEEMVEINYDKLKGKIKEVVGTQSKLAEKIGIDETTISNKLNNNTYFTQKEILKISLILNIGNEEIPDFFFTKKNR